mmetsp:Transcript_103200/g.321612  ORF Transcript_103200/g.321612 Transcript_103200/m.321612 type:complete len:220 (-) Transcript_103200:335-994(-)
MPAEHPHAVFARLLRALRLLLVAVERKAGRLDALRERQPLPEGAEGHALLRREGLPRHGRLPCQFLDRHEREAGLPGGLFVLVQGADRGGPVLRGARGLPELHAQGVLHAVPAQGPAAAQPLQPHRLQLLRDGAPVRRGHRRRGPAGVQQPDTVDHRGEGEGADDRHDRPLEGLGRERGDPVPELGRPHQEGRLHADHLRPEEVRLLRLLPVLPGGGPS